MDVAIMVIFTFGFFFTFIVHRFGPKFTEDENEKDDDDDAIDDDDGNDRRRGVRVKLGWRNFPDREEKQ